VCAGTMATAMSANLTPQQWRAILLRDVSIALSAGAGCGKTHVLTERFLSHLEPDASGAPGARLQDLAAITFTDRAAREMRDRIRRRCRQRLESAPDEATAAYWLQLLRELESARICTIHAFCGALLRAHAVEAGIDPSFDTLDEAQSEALLLQVLDDVLHQQLAGQSAAAIELAVDPGLDTLKRWLLRVVELRDRVDWGALASATAEQWLDAWEEFHRRQYVPSMLRDLAQGPLTQELLELFREYPPHHPEMSRRCANLQRLLPQLPRARDPRAVLRDIRENARVQGGGGARAWPAEEIYEIVKNNLTTLRQAIDQLLRPQGGDGTPDALQFDRDGARPAAVAGLQLLELARPLLQAYQQRKDELAALDFNDLLIRARSLLSGGRRRPRRLDLQFALLLVDEFQDTDPLQVDIVRALCGSQLTRGRLFFVGDHKQSIYRFRRADPRVFAALRSEIPPAGRLPLSRNFRSQPQILAFVNALFCEALDLPDHSYEPLQAHRAQVTSPPCIELLWAHPAGDPSRAPTAADDAPAQDDENAQQLRWREADWIARRIRGWLDQRTPLVAQREAASGREVPRAARPGDIAILFRSLSDVAVYEDALLRHGIDYYLVGGRAFYAQQEIYDLLHLLRAIAWPADSLSLAGALRSPIFALADETLFWLAQHPEGLAGGLWADVLPRHIDPPQQQRVRHAAATLRALRDLRDRVPIAQLIHEALQRTGYDALLLAEFLGTRKLANLHKLIDLARSLDETGSFTLTDFIHQVSQFVASQPREPLAATQPENADVVRLMTIHQAKGLEFPIVCVPDLDRAIRNAHEGVFLHPTLGLLVRPRSTTALTAYDMWRYFETAEDQLELLRLFYVACTRAADYLLLSAGTRQPGQGRHLWMRLLRQRFDLLSGELLADLPEGYDIPQVRVTLECPPTARPPQEPSARQLGRAIRRAQQAAHTADAPRQPRSVGPLAPDLAARREFSFSRIDGVLHQHVELLLEAAAPAQAGLRPTDDDVPRRLGYLVHALLAEVDLHDAASPDRLLHRFAPDYLPHDQAVFQQAERMLHAFCRSPRAEALRRAARLLRETEFLLPWDPASRFVNPPADRSVAESATPQRSPRRYFRGYLDCLYQDASGGWHLLDYKTTHTAGRAIAPWVDRYEPQLFVYALAAEEALGAPLQSVTLVLLEAGAEHVYRWSAAQRRALVQRIEQALHDAVHPQPVPA
jgi:ATP-dependent helicase/nuclease subunit A